MEANVEASDLSPDQNPSALPLHSQPVAATGEREVRIWRGDKSGGEFRSYQIPIQEGMVVLDAVLWVQQHLDGDLAVRWNCKAAKCGSCSAEVNGFPRLMCKSRLSDYASSGLAIRPLHTFP
ncbi:MAG: 2Fe-2S iron-sulfur cluster-binding protein, partial [Candidatus Dormibacteraceae bacterium]